MTKGNVPDGNEKSRTSPAIKIKSERPARCGILAAKDFGLRVSTTAVAFNPSLSLAHARLSKSQQPKKPVPPVIKIRWPRILPKVPACVQGHDPGRLLKWDSMAAATQGWRRHAPVQLRQLFCPAWRSLTGFYKLVNSVHQIAQHGFGEPGIDADEDGFVHDPDRAGHAASERRFAGINWCHWARRILP